jgi:hypothetical protein
MNDLLFYAIIIALLYFFYYLPQQKQLAPIKPLTQSQATQTEKQTNTDNSELEATLDNLIQSIRQLNQQIK